MRPNDGLNAERVWVVVPVFNNRETVRAVIAACAAVMPHVVAVDDGSTDADVAGLLAGLDITLLKHDRNRGKGAAILTASRFIEERGGGYMITLDADGQHDPADIRKFLPLLPAEENAVVVGTEAALFKRKFEVNRVNWMAFESPPAEFKTNVKVRYLHPGAPATIFCGDRNVVRVIFDAPQRAVTPGQAAVFYEGDVVLGGGTIQ